MEIRAASIRIKFTFRGTIYRERLTLNGQSLKPTPANVKYAHRIAAEVHRRIAQDAFTFSEFFPDSPHARDDVSPETFGHLADMWLESQGRLAEATKGQYATAVRFWKKLLGEQRLLKDVTHKLLAAKIGGYAWPSAKTHNNYLIALRGILALEYRGPAAVNNPANGIANMTVVKKLPDPLTVDERDMILADLEAHYDARVHAYFLWQFFTGMRPEETIALRWSDVDWKRKVVRVQRVRTYRGGERDGSKTHTERDVDLLPQALAALQTMKTHTFMLKVEGRDDGAADIFQNPVTGRPWHDERSQRDHYWKPSLKRLGIRWRRAYNTRHTFATAALMIGVPPAYIASQLGHSTKMLLDKYARWIPGNDAGSAREMMERAMGKKDPDVRARDKQ
ncbi:MAG: tyrosine-type recombinase/integrase [Mizugakiibacter sp.]|uniref:tyrosine-type recombinase/integrase n=1 Tax=Mizugakiibacter sp. TaxID=1972610 RepID=UPI0032108451